MSLFEKKILNSILFFANKADNHTITRLKLMKLLWLSDRIHINKYGRFILRDTYYAMEHGPIPSKALNMSQISIENFTHIHERNIKALSNFDLRYFSKSDLEVMEFVWNNYGKYSATRLRNASHKFPEWERFEKLLSSGASLRELMVDGDFFKSPIKKPNIDWQDNDNTDAIEKFQFYKINQSILS